MNFLEYNLNYSDTTSSLCFYYKNEANDFDNYLADTTDFKSFKNKAKLLGNTKADVTNGILKNTTIAFPCAIKYLSNFWRSTEVPLINCKIELKLKLANNCVLSANNDDNDDGNSNNVIFTMKDTKLHVPVVTLTKIYQNFLAKD